MSRGCRACAFFETAWWSHFDQFGNRPAVLPSGLLRTHERPRRALPSMAQRVGSLWATGLAVYQNKDGTLFSMHKGARARLHFNQKWKTSGGIRMRGRTPLGAAFAHDDDDGESDAADEGGTDDDERRQIEWAIQVSLAAIHVPAHGGAAPAAPAGGSMPSVDQSLPAAAAAETTAAGDDAQQAQTTSDLGRRCAICLTEVPTYICRPCNHCCACETCQSRLGSGRPCPICRTPARTMERVFFA